jgi:hypothetical protein
VSGILGHICYGTCCSADMQPACHQKNMPPPGNRSDGGEEGCALWRARDVVENTAREVIAAAIDAAAGLMVDAGHATIRIENEMSKKFAAK